MERSYAGSGIGYLGLGRASRTARRRSLQTVDGGIRHMVTGTGLIFRLRGRYGTALGAKLFRRAGVPALVALWRSIKRRDGNWATTCPGKSERRCPMPVAGSTDWVWIRMPLPNGKFAVQSPQGYHARLVSIWDERGSGGNAPGV